MATPSILRKIGDTAKKYSPFPDETDYKGLKAVQSNVDEYKKTTDQKPAPTPEKKELDPASWERVGRKYGDRPGEKLIDTSSMTKPLGSLPVYDEGGDVDVNDGKHQLAVLQDGEKVLTPEQAQEYDANKPLPHPSEVISQKTGPESGESVAPKAEEKKPTNLAGGVPEGGTEIAANVPPPKPKVDPNSPAGKVIQQDKEKAAMSGDLVGMGKSVINENHLAPDTQSSVLPEETLTPKVQPIDMHQNVAGGPLVAGAAAPDYTKGQNQDFAKLEHDAKLKQFDSRIQQALALNTPSGQEAADRIRLQKMEYERQTPWGSEGNHPGILGRIGHIAAKVGNIAGDVFAPATMAMIPGTDLNRTARRGALGNAISADTQTRLQEEAEQNKMKIAQLGKTPEQITFRALLGKVNPDTGKLYTEEEALQATKTDEANKEKEQYINDEMKNVNHVTGKNFTREEATENYYKMRAGNKPASDKEKALKDYMVAHKMEDTPENRDLAREGIERRDTAAKAEAGLPTAEQKIRLQSELTEANAELNNIRANALQRSEKADDFVQKENARHTMRQTQLDATQNALDQADANMLAASIVPVLATMTETTAQGIKRLNPQELSRFMPKSSGDALQWFAANYDKVVAGQIPDQYKGDLKELLTNLNKEEETQHNANLRSIDETFKQGAVTPVVNEKGKATTTKKAERAAPLAKLPQGALQFKPKTATHFGIGPDGQMHWSNDKGEDLGVVRTK